MTSSMVIPQGQKIEKKFFLFFLRIGSFWLQKCNKKILFRNFPLPGHVTWDLEFFWKISKIFEKIFFVYFFELTNSESKKTKKIFLSIMRSRHHLRLRIFSTNLKSFSIVKFLKSLNVLKVCFQFQQVEQVNKVN